MDQLDDIVREFLVESYENLDQLSHDLVALEVVPDDRDRLSSIFRTIHTIKGTSGFLAFPKLEHVTHVGENLLVQLRDGALRLDSDIATGLLSMVDAVRSILGRIESVGSEGDDEFESLIATLEQLRTGQAPENAAPATPESLSVLTTVNPSGEHADWIGQIEVRAAAAAGVSDDTNASAAVPFTAGSHTEQSTRTSRAESLIDPHEHEHEVTAAVQERGPSVADSTVRIDVDLLDKLMNLVGELVLVRNQILQFSKNVDDPGIAAASQRLNLITSELQEGVMKTRMQPIRNAWNKLPRVVRDLSQACHKQVQVRMEGADTELDKTILEAIRDPLTHIVRNSVDHGIESPEARVAAGKPAEGTLWLRSFHEGGQVNIEIEDDGGGINVERVRAKAVERGLITREQADNLTEREALQLILLPGFSTAETVTNVSGRGVGMDVVKTNVEKIGGTLDIQSCRGIGTTLRIKIPLTLAIVPALIVEASDERYAIPQVSLVELVRLEGERARKGIEQIYDSPVYRLRGKLLPLIHIDQVLGPRDAWSPGADDVINIVVLRADGHEFGLIVDAVRDTEEIVVKPLGKLLKGIEAYAGATIMGDGRVAVILDVLGLARYARVISKESEHRSIESDSDAAVLSNDTESVLVCGVGDNRRIAMPISLVSRLEEIPASAVEYSDRQELVQYRGGLLPLIRLGDYFGIPRDVGDSAAAALQVVVHAAHDRTYGLVVDRVIDAVETRLQVSRMTVRPGMTGATVIDGRVTDLIDLATIIQSCN